MKAFGVNRKNGRGGGGGELKYEKEGVYGINLREDEDGNLSERKICVSNNINSRIYRIYASE